MKLDYFHEFPRSSTNNSRLVVSRSHDRLGRSSCKRKPLIINAFHESTSIFLVFEDTLTLVEDILILVSLIAGNLVQQRRVYLRRSIGEYNPVSDTTSAKCRETVSGIAEKCLHGLGWRYVSEKRVTFRRCKRHNIAACRRTGTPIRVAQ